MEEELHIALAELENQLNNLKSFNNSLDQMRTNSMEITSAATQVVTSLNVNAQIIPQ